MKTLKFQQSRFSFSASLRSISAAVSNFRENLSDMACISVGVASTVALFFSIGVNYWPAIIFCGLVSLLAVAFAPLNDKKGGEL